MKSPPPNGSPLTETIHTTNDYLVPKKRGGAPRHCVTAHVAMVGDPSKTIHEVVELGFRHGHQATWMPGLNAQAGIIEAALVGWSGNETCCGEVGPPYRPIQSVPAERERASTRRRTTVHIQQRIGAFKIEASAYSSEPILDFPRESPWPYPCFSHQHAWHRETHLDNLRSDVDRSRHYVGLTNNLRARLEWHNQGPCGHTLAHRPWSVVVSLEFPAEKEAVRFEKYLNSGSGRASATRPFGR